MGVAQPGPGTALRPAHSRDVSGVEQQAVAPLVSRAGRECVRRRRVGGRDLRREVRVADLVGERGLDGGLGQDANPVELAATEQRPLDLDVVARGGVQAMPACPTLRLLDQVDLTERPGAVRPLDMDRGGVRGLVRTAQERGRAIPSGPVMPSLTATSSVTPMAASTTLPSQSVLMPYSNLVPGRQPAAQ